MVWQYAIGMMIAMPIGIISSVGSYQLTILGKMRVLMILSLGEGLVNLVMDVFFVEVTHLGIAGIGFGTACANILRCSATLIYLVKKTDMFRSGKTKARWAEVKDILYCGMPEAAAAFKFMSHMNQVGQTGSTPRHAKGLSTCCHGEEPHVVGWRFVNERRAVNLDANCGWAQGKADVVYVADAFAVMKKVNELLG